MKKAMSGNITIEASIIVPTMLIILATIILASLLLHDVYVIKTNNSMKADARVISGEDNKAEQGVATFIIKPTYDSSAKKGLFGGSFKATVVGGQTLQPFGLSFNSDEVRDYTVKSPKKLIRTIDFVDDATDMWTGSRGLKDKAYDQLESIEKILTGKE